MAAPDTTANIQEDIMAMSAAQRRERRKQRIIENGDKRMSAILGVGGEKRQAPCIDGPAIPSSSAGSSAGTRPDDSEEKRPPAVKPALKVLDFIEEAPDNDIVDLVPPKYVAHVGRSRFWIALFFGMLLATITLFYDQFGMVLLPALLAAITYEVTAFKSKKLLCPKQSQALNAILAGGLNDDIVVTFGLIVDAFREITIDMLLVTFGFITFKLLAGILTGLIVVTS